MKTLGKLFLLLSFVVAGRWSRPNTPATAATFFKLMAPAHHRAAEYGSRVLLVHNTGPIGSRQAAAPSALALY